MSVQCPNFNALTLVSMAAALMSITYSTIAFGASVAHGAVPDVQYNLDGFTLANGLFGAWNALGTVAFAYGGHNVVLEIQVPILRLARPPHIYYYYYHVGGNPWPRAIGRTRGSLAASPRGPAQPPCNQSATQLHDVGIRPQHALCMASSH